jgi:hypothetical protein
MKRSLSGPENSAAAPRSTRLAAGITWGSVFSCAFAGAGVKGGHVHGASDHLGAEPAGGRVSAADFTAEIFHCLGIDPRAEITGRPVAIGSGNVVHQIL